MVLFVPIDCFWSKIIFYPFVDFFCCGPITALSLVQDHMHVSMCIFKQDFNFSTLHFDCSFLFSCGRTHVIWQQTTFVQDFRPTSGLRTASKLEDNMTRKKNRTEAMRKSYKNNQKYMTMNNDDKWWLRMGWTMMMMMMNMMNMMNMMMTDDWCRGHIIHPHFDTCSPLRRFAPAGTGATVKITKSMESSGMKYVGNTSMLFAIFERQNPTDAFWHSNRDRWGLKPTAELVRCSLWHVFVFVVWLQHA